MCSSKLLTGMGLSEILGVSYRQVFRLFHQGKIPASLRIGGSVRWDRKAIEDWIAQGCPEQQEGDQRSDSDSDREVKPM